MRRIAPGFALGLTLAAPLMPAAAAQGGTPIGDWLLKCGSANGTGTGGTSRCELHQILRDGKGRQIVAFAAMHSGKDTFLSVTLPLGLSIPFGVTLVLRPDTAIPLHLAACTLEGCEAVAPIDATLTGQLKTAQRLGVKFQDSKSGKVVEINGSTNGLTQGLAMLAASAP
jgi:invasion protein IalB